MYRHRFICDVFSEMRSCHKTRNYASMLALVEEAQSMANRMEAAIEAKADYASYREKGKKAEAELKALQEKIKDAKANVLPSTS